MDNDEVPPGVGPPRTFNLLQRRPQPLWVVGLVIVIPLLIVLAVYLARILLGL